MWTKECDACCTLYPHRTLRGNTSEMKRDCMRKRSKILGKCSSVAYTTVQDNKLCGQIATNIGCEHEECAAYYTLRRMWTRECTLCCTLYHRIRTKEYSEHYTLKPELTCSSSTLRGSLSFETEFTCSSKPELTRSSSTLRGSLSFEIEFTCSWNPEIICSWTVVILFVHSHDTQSNDYIWIK